MDIEKLAQNTLQNADTFYAFIMAVIALATGVAGFILGIINYWERYKLKQVSLYASIRSYICVVKKPEEICFRAGAFNARKADGTAVTIVNRSSFDIETCIVGFAKKLDGSCFIPARDERWRFKPDAQNIIRASSALTLYFYGTRPRKIEKEAEYIVVGLNDGRRLAVRFPKCKEKFHRLKIVGDL